MNIKMFRIHLSAPLVLALFIFGCASTTSTISSLKDGESFVQSPNGLLIGSVRWQQGEKIIDPRVSFVGPFPGPMFSISLKDIRTGHAYHLETMKQPHFYLALPPGRYRLLSFGMRSLFSPFNITPGAQREHIVRLSEQILLVYRGYMITDRGAYVLTVSSPLPSFEIKQHEATYIGNVIIDLPDPISDSLFSPKFIVKDEEGEVVKDLQVRFPGIDKIEKYLLNDIRESESVSSGR